MRLKRTSWIGFWGINKTKSIEIPYFYLFQFQNFEISWVYCSMVRSLEGLAGMTLCKFYYTNQVTKSTSNKVCFIHTNINSIAFPWDNRRFKNYILNLFGLALGVAFIKANPKWNSTINKLIINIKANIMTHIDKA